jgi:hypothetical protein
MLFKKAFLVASACLSAVITLPVWANEAMIRQPSNALLIAQSGNTDTSANNTWIPIGYNKDRIASAWVQLKSYEEINENSFRVNAKSTNDAGVQIVGRVDLNCKNKDWYFRPNGIVFQGAPWAAVPEGSGLENLARILCRRTTAKA